MGRQIVTDLAMVVRSASYALQFDGCGCHSFICTRYIYIDRRVTVEASYAPTYIHALYKQAMASLPVIDFSSLDRQANAVQLTQAMETIGFVYLDNVPGYDREVESKLHKAAEWFFSKPLEEKITVSSKNWNKDSSGVYRGYVPINQSLTKLSCAGCW